MNYFDLLVKYKNKEELFLIIDGMKYSYKQVIVCVRELAEKIKIGRNNVVFIYSKNFFFQLIAFLAVQSTGNFPVICHTSINEKVIYHIMKKHFIKYLFTEKRVTEFDWGVNSIFCEERICMGVLSSGSMDLPKLIFRTYESWVDFFHIQNKVFCINSETVLFLQGSFSFTGNLNAVFSVLYEGGTIVCTDKFDCNVWLSNIAEHKVTNIYLVPTKLKALSKFLYKKNNNVKCIFSGSQILEIMVIKKLKEYFSECEIVLYYGTSELSFISYINEENWYEKPMSVGKPFENIDVFIKDGLIYVNTPYSAEGYEGLCTVNDMGHFDDDGHLIFKGREGNMINKGGLKINGTKIENEIKKIEGIENAAVIGYEHKLKGHEIGCFIVAEKGITKKQIYDKLEENLMREEIPKKICFIESIPENESGKIDRKILNSKSYLNKLK